MPDWAVTLVASLVTGGAVLAGVLVTQVHQRKLAESDRAEKRRDEQRRVLVDVLATAWDSYDRFHDLLPALRDLHALTMKELRAFGDSDRIRRVGEASIRLNHGLIQAYLLVGDDELRRAAVRLREVNQKFRDVLGLAARTGDPEQLEPAPGLLEDFRDAVLVLERIAAEHLPIPLGHQIDTNGPTSR